MTSLSQIADSKSERSIRSSGFLVRGILFFLMIWISFSSHLLADSPWLRVTDPKGKPLASANVEVFPLHDYSRVQKFLTNSAGEVVENRVSFEGKDDYIVVRHDGFSSWGVCHKNIDNIVKKGEPLEAKLNKGQTLTGNVILDGKPYSGGGNVWVTAFLPGNGHTHPYPMFEKVSVDASGNFTVQHGDEEKLNVWFEGSKATSTSQVTWKSSDKKDNVLSLNIKASRETIIRIQDENGKPLEHVNFWCAFHEEKCESWKSVNDMWRKARWTDAQGQVRVQIPTKGFYSFEISDGRFKKGTFLNVANKELLKVVTLVAKQELRGSIVSKSTLKGIKGVEVKLIHKPEGKDRSSYRTAKSDDGGDFIFREDNFGEIEALRIWAEGYLPKKITDIKKLSDPVRIELEEGDSFSFRFLQPVPYSEPAILSDFKIKGNWKAKLGTNFNFAKTSDANGVITLVGLEEGADIDFEVEGFVNVELQAKSKGMNEVLLQPNSIIYAVVKDNEGMAITKNLYFKEGKQYFKDKYHSKDKRHKVWGLPAGKHDLQVSSSGYNSKIISVETTVGQPLSIEVTLESTPALTIELTQMMGEHPEKIDYQLSLQDRSRHSSSARKVKSDSKEASPRYKLTSEKLWTYDHISISVEGYIPSTHLLSPSMGNILKVQLKKGLSVTALIVDELEAPVSNVKVTIDRDKARDANFLSDSEGRVQLSGLESDTYKVKVSKEGFVTSEHQLTVIDGRETPRWVLKKGKSLQARVSKNGLALGDVEVNILKANEWGHYDGYFNGRSSTKKSDADGFVKFSGLGVGKYQLKARSEEHGMADSEIITLEESSSPSTIELELQQGQSLNGKVADRNGRGVGSLGLYIYAQMQGGEHQNVTTRSDGTFSFINIKEKVIFRLQLSGDEWELEKDDHLLVKGQAEELLIVVRPMSHMKVLVLDPEGKPISERVNFFVQQETFGGSFAIREAKFKDGSWALAKSHLRLNNYGGASQRMSIQASVEGFNPGKTAYLERDRLFDQVHEIKLDKEQSLSIRVRDAFGKPLDGVSLKIGERGEGAHGMTDKEGLAVLKGIVAGEHKLTVDKNGYAKELQDLKVDPQSNFGEREVILTKGGTIKGRVLNHEGKGIQKARVWLNTTGVNPYVSNNSQSTDVEGHFLMSHVKAGVHRIQFSLDKKGWFNSNKDIQEIEVFEGQETQIDLMEKVIEDAGSLKVVVDADLANQFSMVMANGAGAGMVQKSLEGNEVIFDQLAEGVYQLTLFGQGGMRNQQVEIVAGKQSLVKISDEGTLKVKAKIHYADGTPVQMGVAYLMDLSVVSLSVTGAMKSMNGMGMIRMGELELAAQKAGTFRLMLQIQQGEMAGQQKDLGEVIVSSYGDTELGTIRIVEGKNLKLRVTDESGLPLKGATAYCTKDHVPTSQYTWRSNGDGAMLLKGVPEAPFTVTVSLDGYAEVTQEVDFVQDMSIVLKKGFSVSIRLVGENTAQRMVSLRPETSPSFGNPYQRSSNSLRSDDQGLIASKNLSAGRYILVIAPDGNKGEVKTTEAFDLYEGMGEVSVPMP